MPTPGTLGIAGSGNGIGEGGDAAGGGVGILGAVGPVGRLTGTGVSGVGGSTGRTGCVRGGSSVTVGEVRGTVGKGEGVLGLATGFALIEEVGALGDAGGVGVAGGFGFFRPKTRFSNPGFSSSGSEGAEAAFDFPSEGKNRLSFSFSCS